MFHERGACMLGDVRAALLVLPLLLAASALHAGPPPPEEGSAGAGALPSPDEAPLVPPELDDLVQEGAPPAPLDDVPAELDDLTEEGAPPAPLDDVPAEEPPPPPPAPDPAAASARPANATGGCVGLACGSCPPGLSLGLGAAVCGLGVGVGLIEGGCGGALLVLLGVVYGLVIALPGAVLLGLCTSCGAALGVASEAWLFERPLWPGLLGASPGVLLGLVSTAALVGSAVFIVNTDERAPFLDDNPLGPGFATAGAGLLVGLLAGPVALGGGLLGSRLAPPPEDDGGPAEPGEGPVDVRWLPPASPSSTIAF